MNPFFRYFIYTDNDIATKRECYPVYKDDAAKEVEQENNQKFYRAKLSGKIGFIKNDFDFVVSKSFETQFNFVIERSDDNKQTWVVEYEGKFFQTDCTINYDNKKLTFSSEPVDDYTEVLAGLEKEYNLIPLAPEIEQLLVQKRPLIQVYIPGQSIVSCFLGGNFWEQDCNEVTDRNALVRTYKFALCNMLKEIKLTGVNASEPIDGLYTGRMKLQGNSFSGEMYNEESENYKIVVSMGYNPPWFSIITCVVVRISDNTIVYKYSKTVVNGQVWDNEDFVMQPDNGATGTVNAEMATYNIYARYLLDVERIQDLDTYVLPSDDIVSYNRNYRRAIGYAIDIAYISRNFSSEPTEWGRADSMLYYRPPYSIWGQKFYPIARSTWRYASIWFGFSGYDQFLEVDGRKTYLLKDTFPVHSVIKRLLKQFAPDIQHEPTPEYSQFLYGAENPISHGIFKLFVTQKTNILVGNYQQPAQKAPATLQQFLKMLRDCYRCFWHIENKKLRIEHVSWYNNGGSYDRQNEVISLDLTKLINIRNGKTWGFGTNEISFDKMDMPERYQFKWADDVTEAFEGQAIQVKSKYVKPGKIEDINISGFNSDVDMMMLNPDAMSKEGFALFAAVPANAFVEIPFYDGFYTEGSNGLTEPKIDIKGELGEVYLTVRFRVNVPGGSNAYFAFLDSQNNVITTHSIAQYNTDVTQLFRMPLGATKICFEIYGNENVQGVIYSAYTRDKYELPFVNIRDSGVEYSLQNGALAFITLQPIYWTYDLPARRVEINGSETYAKGIERKKKQNISFPTAGTPNPMQLIKTQIGSGQIDKMSINLHTRSAKTTLKYDTE